MNSENCSKNSEDRAKPIRIDNHTGSSLWIIGWLFTIAFAELVWWKALLAIVVWPYYLGMAVR